jgi:hypothetical protein
MTKLVRRSVVAVFLLACFSLIGPVAAGQSLSPEPSASVGASTATDCRAIAGFQRQAAGLIVALEGPRELYDSGDQKRAVKEARALLRDFARAVTEFDLPDDMRLAAEAVMVAANSDAESLSPRNEQMTTPLTDTKLAHLLATVGAVRCPGPGASAEPSMEANASLAPSRVDGTLIWSPDVHEAEFESDVYTGLRAQPRPDANGATPRTNGDGRDERPSPER